MPNKYGHPNGYILVDGLQPVVLGTVDDRQDLFVAYLLSDVLAYRHSESCLDFRCNNPKCRLENWTGILYQDVPKDLISVLQVVPEKWKNKAEEAVDINGYPKWMTGISYNKNTGNVRIARVSFKSVLGIIGNDNWEYLKFIKTHNDDWAKYMYEKVMSEKSQVQSLNNDNLSESSASNQLNNQPKAQKIKKPKSKKVSSKQLREADEFDKFNIKSRKNSEKRKETNKWVEH